MRVCLTFILQALVSTSVIAQNNSAVFWELVNELNNETQEVRVAKGVFQQEVSAEAPGIILFKNVFTSTKGVSETTVYYLNVADIDIYSVKEFTSRDLIYVQLIVEQNLKFIKTEHNGELKPYESKIQLNAVNIDNARRIVEVIKKMIPVAKEIQKSRLSVSTFDSKIDFIKSNLATSVGLGNARKEQSLEILDAKLGKAKLTVQEQTKKGTVVNEYELNLADFNERLIEVSVKGTSIKLALVTNNKEKFVRMNENQAFKSFVNEVEIFDSSVDNIRDLKKVFELLIPEVKDNEKELFSQINTNSEFAELVNQYITPLTIGETKIEQNVSGDCIFVLERAVSKTKGTETTTYQANLRDINPHEISYKTSSSSLRVVAESKGKQKLFKETVSDEQKPYLNKIYFECGDSESLKRLLYVLKKSVEKCESIPETQLTDAGSLATWLTDNIVNVSFTKKSFTQSVRFISDSDDYELKQISHSGSKQTEMVYVFNVADLNPGQVMFDVSGTNLAISLETNGKSKIIKSYKDGGVVNYVSGFKIYFDELETARVAISVIKKLIEQTN